MPQKTESAEEKKFSPPLTLCKKWLRDWHVANLERVRDCRFPPPKAPDKLTLILYSFLDDERLFDHHEFGILQTWRTIGKYPLVIVTDRKTARLDSFARQHQDACSIVISDSLKSGSIDSMNYDCIVNLHKYFSTPSCLIVQDDGFPIRGGIEDFLGKWDYAGAPLVRDLPWQNLADWMLINIENGGFCLRSRRCCEATANLYLQKKDSFTQEQIKLEDWFYCCYARKNIWHRLKYSFAPASKAREFSFIDIEGLIDIRTLKKTPLGIHGPTTIWQFRNYLAREFGYVDVPVPHEATRPLASP